MENIDKEFWKQLAGSIVRKGLTVIATAFVGWGWISGEQAEGVSRQEVVAYVVAFIFYAAPFLWSWAKIKFNVNAIREARKSEPDTPISDITTKTLEKQSFITSV